MDPNRFRFGEFELDARVRELRRAGELVEIQAKPLALLVYLLRHADRVVASEELLEAVWPGIHVDEGALKTAVRVLRRALRDSASEPRWISNSRGYGYRFHGPLDSAAPAAAGAPSPDPAASAAPQAEETQASGSRPRASLADFVGRETQLDELESALEGEQRVVLLHGPPGVGKTSTALELARKAAAHGCEVHVGRTHDGEGAPPFWPWILILRSWFDARSPEERAQAASEFPELAVLVPEHVPAPSLTRARSEEPLQARFRMFDDVARLLRRASLQRPLLLVLDDLHWADDDSLALLLFLARHAAGMQGLILGTHREEPEESPRGQRLAAVLREHSTQSLGLRGLPLESVARILRDQFGPALADGLVQRIFEATGGNPLFVLELARSLAASGGAQPRDGAPLPIPERLRDAVRSRIRECSSACQRVLRAMSVESAALRLAVLRRALPLEGSELLGAIAEAERAGYVVTHADHVQFAHDVVRETLYEALPASERVLLHRALGEAIEAVGGSDARQILGQVAHHFTESAALARPERALEYAQRAAQAACDVFAYADAAVLYRRALRALDFVEGPTEELRCSLLFSLGEVLGEAGAPFAELQSAFLQAMDLARAHGFVTLWARAGERCIVHMNIRAAFVQLLSLGTDPATARIQSALQEVLPKLEGVLRGRVLLALDMLHCAAGEPELRRPLIAELVAISESTRDVELRCEALMIRWESGLLEPHERETLSGALHECARESKRIHPEVAAHMMDLYLAIERGDRDAAESAGRQLERLAEQSSLEARVCVSFWHQMRVELEGNLARAHEYTIQASRLAAQENWPPGTIAAMGTLHVWWSLQVAGGIRSVLEQARAYYATRPHRPLSRIFLARLHAQCGMAELVQPELDALEDNLRITGLGDDRAFLVALAAECCALIRDRARAAPLFELLRPYAKRARNWGMALCMGHNTAPLGSLAALLGRWDEAEECFASALAHARGMRSPVLLALTELDQAAALLERGRAADRQRSDRLIRSANAAAESLALPGLLERARDLSERASRR